MLSSLVGKLGQEPCPGVGVSRACWNVMSNHENVVRSYDFMVFIFRSSISSN